MRRMLEWFAMPMAVMSVVLMVGCGTARAEDTPPPKPDDAEQNAFQTPTVGQKTAPEAGSKADPRQMTPESRLNDDPPAHERVGAPNTTGK